MLTQEDLDHIGKLIGTSLDAKLEPLKKEMATKADLAAVRSDLAAVEKRLTKKIDEGHEQIIDTIIRTGDEIIEQQEPRLSQIEEHLGLEHHAKKN
jgi:Mg2+ and Co2+ transporter CorA